MTRRPIATPLSALTLVLLLIQGCSGGTPDGDATSAPVDVATTTDTVVDAGTDTMADADEDTDGLSISPPELPVITEIDEDSSLPPGFLDALAPEPDAIPDTATPDPGDAQNPTDALAMDVAESDVMAMDVADSMTDSTADVDDVTSGVPDTFLSDCDNLGVAPSWEGTFQGAIQYHLPESLAALFSPLDGILIVDGALAFDIECVDSKLIVSGDMDGTATVSGEGEFPFLVTLGGYFNPQTGLLNATMILGMVVIFEEVELYFSGDFIGTLADGDFTGLWTGQYDGTNFPAMDPTNEVEAFACPQGYSCSWVATPTETE